MPIAAVCSSPYYRFHLHASTNLARVQRISGTQPNQPPCKAQASFPDKRLLTRIRSKYSMQQQSKRITLAFDSFLLLQQQRLIT
jgi:hypothetical protein